LKINNFLIFVRVVRVALKVLKVWAGVPAKIVPAGGRWAGSEGALLGFALTP
jgi:hypothetical protein